VQQTPRTAKRFKDRLQQEEQLFIEDAPRRASRTGYTIQSSSASQSKVQSLIARFEPPPAPTRPIGERQESLQVLIQNIRRFWTGVERLDDVVAAIDYYNDQGNEEGNRPLEGLGVGTEVTIHSILNRLPSRIMFPNERWSYKRLSHEVQAKILLFFYDRRTPLLSLDDRIFMQRHGISILGEDFNIEDLRRLARHCPGWDRFLREHHNDSNRPTRDETVDLLTFLDHATTTEYASFQEISTIARDAWRQQQDENRASGRRQDQAQPQSGQNHWAVPTDQLYRKPGWPKRNNDRTKLAMVRWQQLRDAHRGLLPQLDPEAISKHHIKTLKALRTFSEAKKVKGPGRLSYLNKHQILEKLAGAQVEDYDFLELASEDNEAQRSVLLTNLAKSLGFANFSAFASLLKSTLTATTVLNTTPTRGIVGDEMALSNLQEAINNEFFPVDNTGSRLLCGPLALADSLHANREALARANGFPVPLRISADSMMNTLFTNHVPLGNPSAENLVGIPTPEYEEYIRATGQRFLDDNDEFAFNDHWTMMTAMENLNFQQLQAIVELLYRSGQIEFPFAIGVVTGKCSIQSCIVLMLTPQRSPSTWWAGNSYSRHDIPFTTIRNNRRRCRPTTSHSLAGERYESLFRSEL
jgi:hypothetical protein